MRRIADSWPPACSSAAPPLPFPTVVLRAPIPNDYRASLPLSHTAPSLLFVGHIPSSPLSTFPLTDTGCQPALHQTARSLVSAALIPHTPLRAAPSPSSDVSRSHPSPCLDRLPGQALCSHTRCRRPLALARSDGRSALAAACYGCGAPASRLPWRTVAPWLFAATCCERAGYSSACHRHPPPVACCSLRGCLPPSSSVNQRRAETCG